MTTNAAHPFLYHIYLDGELHSCSSDGEYRPHSLASEGFIHLSSDTQLLATAERYYSGATDPWVARVEVRRLRAVLRFESVRDDLYPHLYGALNLDAVVERVPLLRDANGRYLHPFRAL